MLLEQALMSCIDYFSMGGLSQKTRHKLIKAVLVDTNTLYERKRFENKMNIAQGLEPMPIIEREGIFQLFHYCHHRAIEGGNPGPKLTLIRDALYSFPPFESYRPEDDFSKSLRSKPTKLPSIEIEDLEPPE